MKFIVEKFECLNRLSIPPEGKTIADEFDIDKMVPLISRVDVYLRDPATCPFGRGNWMIDIRFSAGNLFSIKLPKEMKEDQVDKFIEPLVNLLEESKKSI